MSGVEFLTGAVSQAVGWALLHLLWQGTVIAALLGTVLTLMDRRSANARYLVACAALAILLACGAVTAVRNYEPPLSPPAVTATIGSALPAAEAPASNAVSVSEPASFEWRPFLRTHLPEIVLLWMIGVALLSVRLLGSWIRALSLAAGAAPAPPQWQRTLLHLSEALRLRRVVRLVESAAVEVPTVIGWVRPVILLPLSTLSGLSTEQIEMVLAHEIAHIRRHDFLVNLLQAVAETLLFYHPAVWWMSRRVRIEREHCCDDLAVAVCGNALQYARALTRLEELRVDNAQAVLAANGGSLLSRVRRLVGSRRDTTAGASRWIAGAAVLTGVALTLGLASTPLLAQRGTPSAPAAPAAPSAPVTAPVLASTPRPGTPAPPAPPATPGVLEVHADGRTYWHHGDATEGESTVVDEEAMVAAAQEAAASALSDAQSEGTPVPSAAPAPALAPTPSPEAWPLIDLDEKLVKRLAIAPRAVIPMAGIRALTPAVRKQVEAAIAAVPPGFRLRDRRHIDESKKLTVDDLITLRSVGVTPEYIQQIRSLGLGDLSLDDIVDMRVLGVKPEEVSKLRGAGLGSLSAKDIASLRAQGVTAEYVTGLRAAGVTIANVKDALSLRSVNVTPEFVKSLADAGYANLPVRDLVRLRAMGVSAEFARDMARYRTNK